MKTTDRRSLWALALITIFIAIIGAIMLRLNRQPKVTPASSTGSMQEQLQRQSNPRH